ncbi:MAG: ABC transporter ATP-binding protein [Eubacterium sp.]|nr:ABC transporter ATP-binding protein [Eubacterium sp.]
MKSKGIKRVFSYMGRYKIRMIIGFIAAIVSTVFSVVAPVILGSITTILYDGVIDGKWMATDDVYFEWGDIQLGKVGTIFLIVVLLGLIYVVAWIFGTIANSLFSNVAARVIQDLRDDIDEKMHRIKLNYYDTRTNGEILSVITNDVEAINLALGKNLYNAVLQLFTLIGTIVMMFLVNIWLTLVAIAMVPVTIILSGGVLKASGKNFKKQQDMLGELNGYVEEMYNGKDVVSSFNYQERSIEHFEEVNTNLQEVVRKSELASGSVMPVTQMVNNLGYAVNALIGCLLALNGSITVGNVQSMVQYTKSFNIPFTQLSLIAGQLTTANAAAHRVFELVDAEEEIPDPEMGKKPQQENGAVEFSHVQFGYVPGQTLMNDVSVSVKPGQKCAIVGPTGAGKTTLINLLMRFYEIGGGTITVDGVDTKQMTRHELRRHFGMVLQDTWLFEGTIRDNLKYSTDRDVSEDEMEKATASVCADGFIRTMPGGYDMVLSKGAENISQGQRQLLTIARAILANPEIMILDEATSNVDAHTEQVIQDAMATLMKGRTSFVIAHRLSTIRDADMILYMENGDIKEVGDHDELMAKGGKYAALYNSQFA